MQEARETQNADEQHNHTAPSIRPENNHAERQAICRHSTNQDESHAGNHTRNQNNTHSGAGMGHEQNLPGQGHVENAVSQVRDGLADPDHSVGTRF